MDNSSRSHSEFLTKPPSPTPLFTAGLSGSGIWDLTIVWSLQDEVPCGLGPAILSTGHSDTAWAQMWGWNSQLIMTTVTAHSLWLTRVTEPAALPL